MYSSLKPSLKLRLAKPAPFSAVAKKGVTIELHYKTFPLFARAERGMQGGEYV
jgi:hypothetical protein